MSVNIQILEKAQSQERRQIFSKKIEENNG